MNGDGVEKDGAHAVSLLRQILAQEDSSAEIITDAQSALATAYASGNGVEADTAQAALLCKRAAQGGSWQAIQNLPLTLKCHFCDATPASKVCARCRKVRYCDAQCQRARWNREADPHRAHCRRRTAEASEENNNPAGGGGAS